MPVMLLLKLPLTAGNFERNIMWRQVINSVVSLYVALCAALVNADATTAPQPAAVILVPPIVYQDFKLYTDGKKIEDIDFYGGPGARRDVIEVVLMYQALSLGGFDQPIELHPVDSYKRILHMLGDGKALMAANSVWLEDLSAKGDRYLVSDALIRNGEFEVGLYVRPDKAAAITLNSAADLSSLTAVSSRNWTTDWRTLETLPLKSLYDAPLWYSMVKMVVADRADLLLAPFQPNESMALQVKGVRLTPVLNVKIQLDGSRHWVLSRKHPQGARAWAALQSGMDQMHGKGRITRAYQESGTFNSQVSTWKILNPKKETQG